MSITPREIESVGNWYPKHHTICPSIPCIFSAVQYLRKNKGLPTHRLCNPTELLAGEILGFLKEKCIGLSDAGNALQLASALVHVAYSQNVVPGIDRGYIKTEIEGMARMADYVADDILREIEQGVGG